MSVDEFHFRHRMLTTVVLSTVRFVIAAGENIVDIDVILYVVSYSLIVILEVASKGGVQQKEGAGGSKEDDLEAECIEVQEFCQGCWWVDKGVGGCTRRFKLSREKI